MTAPDMNQVFKKRIYRSLADFMRDFWFPVRNRKRLRQLNERGLVAPAFRERLMIAVTAVNGCRYCSYFHARQALKTGVSAEEIRDLMSGVIAGCPEDEVVALAYAQHWAEADGHPSAEAVQRLQDVYGEENAHAIELVLRLIRLGNLMGNTWDYILYRATFGKWPGLASSI